MAVDHTGVMFTSEDTAEVLSCMEDLAVRGDGRGWLNLLPWVEDEDRPPTSPLGRMFSARGPEIPQATWVPQHRRGRSTVRATIGISHPTGRFAVRRLAENGVHVPQAWTVRQDHVRRGLVFELPDGVGAAEVLRFLMAATEVLSGVETDGRWVADIAVQRGSRRG
ncbi:MAG: hypothetical protein J4F44_04830 [Acidimicrobiia bacterium]|nr:hypothetical protein [Acidimicrobiia bacterium]